MSKYNDKERESRAEGTGGRKRTKKKAQPLIGWIQ